MSKCMRSSFLTSSPVFATITFFFPATQFPYRKGLFCTDAMLTIPHDLQNPFDAGMEFYIVQLDFSPAFDRVRHSGLLLKLKCIGVGGSVLSICREFLSNCRQRVVVESVTSMWITIVSGAFIVL